MKHGRLDDNHLEIVQALRDAKCGVLSLADLGSGVPDILVWSWAYRCLMLQEIKDGAKSPSRRQLTPDESRWHEAWPGPVQIVYSIDDALRAAGVIK